MMDQFIVLASQFGFGGLCALAAGWYVVQPDMACNKAHEEMNLRHGTERKEWMESTIRLHAEALAQAKENSAALDRNTAVLSEIRALISKI